MNAVMTEADFRKLPGTAGRAFLLFGKEDYLKSHAIKSIRQRICADPAFAVFNDITLDALDFTPDKLLDAMTPPPMMADERLILIRGLDFNAMKQGEVEALIETLALLPEYDYNTVLIHVAAGCIDEGFLPKKPSPLFKKLSEAVTPVQFVPPTDSRLAAWVGKHFAHLGVNISPADCAFFTDYAGNSMYLLANEIEKVAYYVLSKGRNVASAEDIRLVAVPEMGADAFALSNAILAGRSADALNALAVLKFERTEPTIVMADISKTFCDIQIVRTYLDAGKSVKEISGILKMHEYKTGLLAKAASRLDPARLSRAIALCTEADAAVKGASAGYTAIEKLIASL